MKKTIFESNRRFTIFDITVSHGQLLLRSQKDEDNINNVDIIFFDTKLIHSYYMFNGLEISKITDQSSDEYTLFQKYLNTKSDFIFELKSENDIYYIVASFLRVYENSLNFSESSLNFHEHKGLELTNSF